LAPGTPCCCASKGSAISSGMARAAKRRMVMGRVLQGRGRRNQVWGDCEQAVDQSQIREATLIKVLTRISSCFVCSCFVHAYNTIC
jgi:hypothetical protein